MNTETRGFHLGDILSVTTRRNVCPNAPDMTAVRDLLTFMCGMEPLIVQVERFTAAAAAGILAQHPQLAGVLAPDDFGDEGGYSAGWRTTSLHSVSIFRWRRWRISTGPVP